MVRVMKKVLRIGLIIVVILIGIGFITYKVIEDNLKNLLTQEIESININTIDDGIYQGKYEVFPVSVELNVEVKNHQITDIEIIKHDNGQRKPAETIISTIIEHNSIDVDVVSGASYSSKTILHAVSNALNQK